MDLQSEKIELIKLLINTTDPKLIESVKNIFNESSNIDFWEELNEAQKKNIEKGLSEIESGKVVSYDSFMKKHR